MSAGLLILGNQLFDPKHLKDHEVTRVFMREDFELCTYYKFHKQKIAFFLSAMRSYRDELTTVGYDVHYEELARSKNRYEEHLLHWAKSVKLKKLFVFEIEDKFFEKRIFAALEKAGLSYEVLPTPMFLTSRAAFDAYLKKTKRPFMKTFYEAQRKRLKIMVDGDGEPLGGRWSFDEMNRKPLPKTMELPDLPKPRQAATDVPDLVEKHFRDHPGELNELWLPTTRKGAHEWLKKFLDERLANFGPYEDAIPERAEFLFHSVLTPFLNTGLLTPDEVVRLALRAGNAKKLNIASIEGFIRQVIGWREFVRGIYRGFSEKQDTTNFWQHTRKLHPAWYEGGTGVAPLDMVIQRVHRRGYAHHIERLMIVGNLMLLLEIDPREAHRWFMEMFVDSSDWVMGPNVYGMGIFSDGGIFATKPYICGSNYYRKMGGFAKAPWCDEVDGLYWGFIDKHRDFFSRNPRLSMMVRTLDKMDKEKKAKLFAAASALKARITLPG